MQMKKFVENASICLALACERRVQMSVDYLNKITLNSMNKKKIKLLSRHFFMYLRIYKIRFEVITIGVLIDF